MTLAFNAGSFAPFAFSPVAYAIQALIEELQAERVNGGGGRARRQAAAKPAEPRRRELTREEVEAQWELLEARLRAQREREAPPADLEPRRAAVPTPAPTPAPEPAPAAAGSPLPGLALPGVLQPRVQAVAAPAQAEAQAAQADGFTDDDMLAVALALLALD